MTFKSNHLIPCCSWTIGDGTAFGTVASTKKELNKKNENKNIKKRK